MLERVFVGIGGWWCGREGLDGFDAGDAGGDEVVEVVDGEDGRHGCGGWVPVKARDDWK